MKYQTTLIAGGAIALLLIGIAIGMSICRGVSEGNSKESTAEHAVHNQQETLWTCAMHPQIKLPKPGKCPICFMDLIPVKQTQTSSLEDSPNRIAMSPLARKLAQISTTPVVRRGLSSEIRLSGKVAIDETRKEIISARFHGRIDRLYVNSTGITVRKGDHLAEIYSPDLVSAQQELLGAVNALSSSSADTNLARTYRRTLEAAKEKLRLLGFSDQDIDAVISRQTPSDHMTMRSRQGGVVLEKMAVEGAYIEAGMPIYTIADLSTVWVKLDAYESDLQWLRPGQKIEFTVEAWPGETFTGTIHFIDPVIDPMMRTVKVRVEAPNPGNRLKPEMLVRAIVRVDIAASGKILGESLRGKWICPMHPNIVKNAPGVCDICTMPLETAESLGYVTSEEEQINPLVIPATAPLITGERAIVYVEIKSAEQIVYEGREVVLGPRVGDYYIVKSGLKEGEKVVTNGAFQIDSELQIRAKKSMMNPQGGGPVQTGHAGHGTASTTPQLPAMPKETPAQVSSSLIKELEPLYSAYFKASDDLSRDDLPSAKKSFENLFTVLQKIKGEGDKEWEAIASELANSLAHRQHIASLDDARMIFEKISTQVIRLAKKKGSTAREMRYVVFCPMAFDGKGAYWLQKQADIVNPYLGSAMPKCGEIKEKISPVTNKKEASHIHD